jgi:hypothetical protein
MQTASNVISVDFHSAPVLIDYAQASQPQGEIARRLAAEAAEQSAKLAESPDKKAGTLRMLASGRGDLFHLNPYLVSVKEGWNCRDLSDPENIKHIDDLARSIAEIGVQEALTVVLDGDVVNVTDGHCRLFGTYRAIEVYGAEIKSIPLRAESRLTTPADHILRQLLNGKPKTPLEMGNAFAKLIGFGWNVKQIAAKSGIGVNRVNQILDLMAGANDGIKELVTTGKVSATTAAQVLRDAAGDATVAEKTLKGAVAVASAAGKTKATGKHVTAVSGERPTSTKGRLQSVFNARSTSVETDGRTTVVTMTTANWKEISKVLNLA